MVFQRVKILFIPTRLSIAQKVLYWRGITGCHKCRYHRQYVIDILRQLAI